MADLAIEVQSVTAGIGAEVKGVDLRDDLEESTVAAIRQALLDHLVLFFRNQELSPQQHLAFAARFGEPRLPMGGRPRECEGIDPYFDVLEDTPDNPPKADFWHTDVAFVREPPDIAVLAMEETPDVGGDTSWLNLYALHDGLSRGNAGPGRRLGMGAPFGAPVPPSHHRHERGGGLPGDRGRSPGDASPPGAHTSRDRTQSLCTGAGRS